MIPHRIKLSGFLSYKGEQEILFGDASLWMLAGTNGSGKSAIFDAVTYALFGHHRGGSLQAVELINKDSNTLSVEFDFRVENDLFQAKRTLRRNKRGSADGTQQIYHHELDSETDVPHWMPVADTSKKVDFDAWIRDKIGLNYETFTSSVLLLQGRAEKLLDSKPSGRAEVLAGIVDLARYQRLSDKADTRRKGMKYQLDDLQSQRDAIAEVSEAQLFDAEERIHLAEQVRETVVKDIERLRRHEFDAQRWADFQQRLTVVRNRRGQAESLLGDASKIEQEYTRWKELKEVSPHLLEIQRRRSALEESQSRTNDLLQDREAVLQNKSRIEHSQETVRKKRIGLQTTLSADEAKLQGLGAKLRDLSSVITTLGIFETQQTEFDRLQADLKKLPADPRGAVEKCQQLVDQRLELNTVIPIMERFAAQRDGLRESRIRAEKARTEEARIKSDGEKRKQLSNTCTADLDRVRAGRRTTDDRVAETRTLLTQAQSAVDEFSRLEGSKVCRACGQALTPAHHREELKKRKAELTTASTNHRNAIEEQTALHAKEKELATQAEAYLKELEELREGYRDRKREADQAEKDAERCAEDCRRAYGELPNGYRERIAPEPPLDWATTTYPAATDLVLLKREGGQLEEVRKRLRDAQAVNTKWENLQTHAGVLRHQLDKLRAELPPGDPTALRADHSSCQAEEAAVKKNLIALRKALTDNEAEADRFSREGVRISQQLTDLTSKIDAEGIRREHDRDALDRTRKLLPEKWRELAWNAGMHDHHTWNMELEDLTHKGTEARWEQLAQARLGITSLKQEMESLEQESSTIPEEARCPVEEIRRQLMDAQRKIATHDQEVQTARKEKGILDHHREQRANLELRMQEVERDLKYLTLLSQLLGRDRLQRHMVRQAERQIVDCANGVLDRLSGGQLFLRLCGGVEGAGTDHALDLEAYNRTTGDAPINVAFLSGSQRFRVAVSLALGIGQYAGHRHRPIESVIIDEGFGCLDRQGRQVMIQELQNLRGQLHCILLVSHQEEFADAFADGYRFELNQGATKVTRFRR